MDSLAQQCTVSTLSLLTRMQYREQIFSSRTLVILIFCLFFCAMDIIWIAFQICLSLFFLPMKIYLNVHFY